MQPTIFERIIAREIPSTIEFEDDRVIAIRDIAPSAPVHMLIIPKRVIRNVDDLVEADAELVGHVFLVARDLARKYGVVDNGYRIVTNCNEHAGQTVFHLHFHLLAGEPLGRMNSRPPRSADSPRMMLFEGGLLVIAAIALAAVFNSMNPRQIPWVKKEYERTHATDEQISKYVSAAAPSEPVASAEASKSAPAAAAPTTTTTISVKTNEAPVTAAPAEKPKSTFVVDPGKVLEIGHDAFVRLMSTGSFHLIDARTPEKYAEGHIASAINIFGGEAQSRIPDIIQAPRDRVILIYCDGGECELSHHVADVLKQFGYGPIFIYTGGWADWKTKH
jgi:histidine triad (HIT) family protein